MKKRACMAAVLAAAGILTACSGGQKESGEKVFQIGFTTAAVENDPYYIFAKNFSDLVSEKVEGALGST